MPLAIRDANNTYGCFQAGDILFKNTESLIEIGTLIQAGQALSALAKFWNIQKVSDVKWEHAAIASNDSGTILEAVSAGVTVNEMATGADYIVFRCKHPNVAKCAANFAQMVVEQRLEEADTGQDRFQYSIRKALKAWALSSEKKPTIDSVEARIDALWPLSRQTAQPEHMFCSQFVALCYIVAAEQENMEPSDVIPREDHRITPYEMVSLLRNNSNWEFIGISARGNHP